jgi:hypothetical protein
VQRAAECLLGGRQHPRAAHPGEVDVERVHDAIGLRVERRDQGRPSVSAHLDTRDGRA